MASCCRRGLQSSIGQSSSMEGRRAKLRGGRVGEVLLGASRWYLARSLCALVRDKGRKEIESIRGHGSSVASRRDWKEHALRYWGAECVK
jgi:hypothetical protein